MKPLQLPRFSFDSAVRGCGPCSFQTCWKHFRHCVQRPSTAPRVGSRWTEIVLGFSGSVTPPVFDRGLVLAVSPMTMIARPVSSSHASLCLALRPECMPWPIPLKKNLSMLEMKWACISCAERCCVSLTLKSVAGALFVSVVLSAP